MEIASHTVISASPEILFRIISISLRLRSPFHGLTSIQVVVRLLLILNLQPLLLRQSLLLLSLLALSLNLVLKERATFSCSAAFSFRRSSFSKSAFSAARSGNLSTFVLLRRLMISLVLFSTRTFFTCFCRWNPI